MPAQYRVLRIISHMPSAWPQQRVLPWPAPCCDGTRRRRPAEAGVASAYLLQDMPRFAVSTSPRCAVQGSQRAFTCMSPCAAACRNACSCITLHLHASVPHWPAPSVGNHEAVSIRQVRCFGEQPLQVDHVVADEDPAHPAADQVAELQTQHAPASRRPACKPSLLSIRAGSGRALLTTHERTHSLDLRCLSFAEDGTLQEGGSLGTPCLRCCCHSRLTHAVACAEAPQLKGCHPRAGQKAR